MNKKKWDCGFCGAEISKKIKGYLCSDCKSGLTFKRLNKWGYGIKV